MTTQQFMISFEFALPNQATSLKNLETQVGQLVNTIMNLPQWTLPSDTEHILKNEDEEHYEAITIGNGKESSEVVEKPTPPKLIEEENLVDEKVMENEKGQDKNFQVEDLTMEVQNQELDKQHQKISLNAFINYS